MLNAAIYGYASGSLETAGSPIWGALASQEICCLLRKDQEIRMQAVLGGALERPKDQTIDAIGCDWWLSSHQLLVPLP